MQAGVVGTIFLLPYVWCRQHKPIVKEAVTDIMCAFPDPVTLIASFVNLIEFMDSRICSLVISPTDSSISALSWARQSTATTYLRTGLFAELPGHGCHGLNGRAQIEIIII